MTENQKCYLIPTPAGGAFIKSFFISFNNIVDYKTKVLQLAVLTIGKESAEMKISDLFEEMSEYFGKLEYGKTCDTYKAGNSENEITKIGISMFATPDVIRKCVESNINFLIVHEPVFYNHWDDTLPNDLAKKKKEFIENSKVTVARYHDHAHIINNDLIYDGEIKFSGLRGKTIKDKIFGVTRFETDEEMTAKELAVLLEKNLGLKHIRIAGCPDKKGNKISCCFGTPGHVEEELEKSDFVLTGEICEWATGEMARDYAQLGYNKAILVMGHIGSERAGMMRLCEILKEKHPEIDTKYIECEEVYTYTDD